jgi:hypothetical protein
LHTVRTLKKVFCERRTGIYGGVGCAHTPIYTPPGSSQVVFSVHAHSVYDGSPGNQERAIIPDQVFE